jgi:DNA-binding NarL/FixJ family response regulator
MLTVHQSNDRIFEAICAGASGYLLESCPRDDPMSGRAAGRLRLVRARTPDSAAARRRKDETGDRGNVYAKLHVNNRSGAVAKALRENLL